MFQRAGLTKLASTGHSSCRVLQDGCDHAPIVVGRSIGGGRQSHSLGHTQWWKRVRRCGSITLESLLQTISWTAVLSFVGRWGSAMVNGPCIRAVLHSVDIRPKHETPRAMGRCCSPRSVGQSTRHRALLIDRATWSVGLRLTGISRFGVAVPIDEIRGQETCVRPGVISLESEDLWSRFSF